MTNRTKEILIKHREIISKQMTKYPEYQGEIMYVLITLDKMLREELDADHLIKIIHTLLTNNTTMDFVHIRRAYNSCDDPRFTLLLNVVKSLTSEISFVNENNIDDMILNFIAKENEKVIQLMS